MKSCKKLARKTGYSNLRSQERNKEELKSESNEGAISVSNKNKIKTGLTCFYTNMRSVFSYNKRDELYMYILEHKYDIVGLS